MFFNGKNLDMQSACIDLKLCSIRWDRSVYAKDKTAKGILILHWKFHFQCLRSIFQIYTAVNLPGIL